MHHDNHHDPRTRPCRVTAKGPLALLAAALLFASAQAGAVVITENFTGGSFDPANFQIGGGSGSAASGAWVSSSNRGTLRTVASNLFPSAGSPLTVTADLTFPGPWDIAFIALRSSGLPVPGVYSEPNDSLYLRLHNLHNSGQIDVAIGGSLSIFQLLPGTAFWSSPVRVSLVDDGASLDVTLTSLASNVAHNFLVNTSYSGGGHVAFAGSGNSAWDNISIGYGSAVVSGASVPEPATGALLALVMLGSLAVREAARLRARSAA